MLAAAAELPPPDDAEVEMLLTETELVVEADGLRSYQQRLVYRILKPTGLDAWSTVESPWSPWYQERPVIRARVITPQGRVHELDPATVAEAPGEQRDPGVFRDTRELQAPLPAVQVGALVETLVHLEHKEPFFAEGESRRHWLAMTVPVRRSRTILDTPEGLELRIETGGFDGEPEVLREEDPAGARVRRIWEVNDLEPVLSVDPGLPSDVPMAPYVAFGTGTSWAELARDYSRIVDEQIAASAEHAAELAAFAGDGEDLTSQWERMQQLIASLHGQVRYTGVQFGDAGIVPRAPHETLDRRFGDCKDKAVLLTALLRREGIPAYLALLNTGPGPEALPELPGLGLFDHAIVYVPGGSPLWIDATDPYSPLGDLPASDEDRWALIASSNTSGLIRTPASGPEDNLTHEVREIFLAPLGNARVVETSELRGDPAWELRAGWADAEPAEIRSSLEGYVGDTYGAAHLVRFDHTPPSDTTRAFQVEVEAEEASYGATDLQEALVLLSLTPLFEGLPAQLFPRNGELRPPREHDYVLLQPYRTIWEYRVHLPENLELRQMPEALERSLGPATFSQSFELSEDGRTLAAHVVFDTGERRYTPAEVTAFQEAVLRLNEERRSQVLVWFDQTVHVRLSEQGVAAAVAEAQRLIGLEPGRALPRALLSRVLLSGGLGEEARRSAAEATRREPDAPVGHQLQAWALVHDEVGRQFRTGFDREGALAAYRRALELDPDNRLIRTDYAILLEHDADGNRYAEDADLDAAIEQYRLALETDDNDQIATNLLIALMWAERFEELREGLKTYGETQSRSFLSVVATAVLDSSETALRDARRQLPDLETRVGQVSAAARNLMLLRRYETAAALFRGAGRDASNAAALLNMAELLDGVQPYESLSPDPTTYEGLFQALLVTLIQPGEPDPADFRGLLAPALRRELDRQLQKESEQDEALPLSSFMQRVVDTADIPRKVLLDLLLGSLTVVPREETPYGSRVSVRFPLAQESGESEAYLVRDGQREGGTVLFVAGSDDPGVVAYEVLDRVERGDLEGARAWLDMIYDAASAPIEPDEPLSGSVFNRLWTPGRGSATVTGDPPAGEAEMRAAAAVLLASLADESSLERAASLLEEARESVPQDRQTALDLGLAAALSSLESWQELRPVAERLAAAEPDSEIAFQLQTQTLVGLKDADALERLARRALEKDPQSQIGQIALSESALLREDIPKVLDILAGILRGPAPTPTLFNNAAWYALVLGRVDEEALRWAQEAAQRGDYQDRFILHTLASIYAELGRPQEAYRVLLQGMEATQEPPDFADWYVLGRLAEQYGLPEAARRYYERARSLDSERTAYSIWALAGRRLAELPDAS